MNISKAIEGVRAISETWSAGLFFSCMDSIGRSGFAISFWEGEENWASISSNNLVVGYMWRKSPLVLIDSAYSERIKSCLKEYQFISFIAVKSLYEMELSVDPDVLKDEIDVYFDKQAFSAEEFWFQTNSR
jgi:hypothetical protein